MIRYAPILLHAQAPRRFGVHPDFEDEKAGEEDSTNTGSLPSIFPLCSGKTTRRRLFDEPAPTLLWPAAKAGAPNRLMAK